MNNFYLKSVFKIFLHGLMAIFLTGCSTLFNRAPQGILVRTSDPKQSVKIEVTTSDGAYIAKTPTVIFAESNWSGVRIQITDKCYLPMVYEVPTTVDLSYWGNILWTHALLLNNPIGLVYFAVDPISGYLWKYDTHVLVPVSRKKNCD
jgi:hypothetical protein